MIKDALILWEVFKRRYPSRLGRNDIVMDIGSGDRPHPRANILLERFVEDCSQRAGPVVTEGRPLVVGDITALPFLNRSIDYIICSHVLEHMETSSQLDMALSELMRVGRRGYIETPSSTFEKLLGAPYHHWYVARQGGRVIFTRKRKYGEYEDLMKVFLPLHRESKTFFQLLFENFDDFFVSLEWEDKINYLIEDLPAKEEMDFGKDYPADLVSGVHKLGEKLEREHQVRMLLKRTIHKVVTRKAKPDLFRILACPLCKNRVIISESRDKLACLTCSRNYQVRDGIPIMLPGGNG